RDFHVTGVQTCALPIYRDSRPIDSHLGPGRTELPLWRLRLAARALARRRPGSDQPFRSARYAAAAAQSLGQPGRTRRAWVCRALERKSVAAARASRPADDRLRAGQ